MCGMLKGCKDEETVVEETDVVKADVKAGVDVMKNTFAWLKVKDPERRGIKWDKKTWLLPDCSEQLYLRAGTIRQPAP